MNRYKCPKVVVMGDRYFLVAGRNYLDTIRRRFRTRWDWGIDCWSVGTGPFPIILGSERMRLQSPARGIFDDSGTAKQNETINFVENC